MIFFFQAEDGIRDADVTGVQTCALPIYIGSLALNYNRLESDMEYASSNEITQHFKSLGINQLNTEGISTLSDVHHLTLKKPNEFWRILLILAIAFFLAEMLIVIFWKV